MIPNLKGKILRDLTKMRKSPCGSNLETITICYRPRPAEPVDPSCETDAPELPPVETKEVKAFVDDTKATTRANQFANVEDADAIIDIIDAVDFSQWCDIRFQFHGRTWAQKDARTGASDEGGLYVGGCKIYHTMCLRLCDR